MGGMGGGGGGPGIVVLCANAQDFAREYPVSFLPGESSIYPVPLPGNYEV